jgi:hypothetical protein
LAGNILVGPSAYVLVRLGFFVLALVDLYLTCIGWNAPTQPTGISGSPLGR